MASVNPQPLQFQDPAVPVDDDDDTDGADDDAMDELEDAHVSSVNVLANAATATPAMPSRTSELTLSFEGEVYVFPAVTPQKVILFLYSFFFFFIYWNLLELRSFFFLFYCAMVRRFVDVIHCNWLGSFSFFGKFNKLRGGGVLSEDCIEKVNNTGFN